jgi:hypothetical protein
MPGVGKVEVVWRPAVHADLPRILELWAEQEKRFGDTGVPVDRPELFYAEGDRDHAFYPYKPPVINVVVAEQDGVITGWRYTEAVCEVCVVTGSREVMRSMGTELTREAHWAKAKGFRSGLGLIPKKFVGAFAHFLRAYPHIRPWRSLTPVGIDFKELGD